MDSITFPWVLSIGGIIILSFFRFFGDSNQYIFKSLNKQRQTSLYSSLTMPVFVSIVVLLSGLYIILSKNYEPAEQKWAFGIVGTIVGYWLKPNK